MTLQADDGEQILQILESMHETHILLSAQIRGIIDTLVQQGNETAMFLRGRIQHHEDQLHAEVNGEE